MKLSNEAKIGMMIFLAGLILFGGILYLRGISFKSSEYSLVLLYENVGGLKEGSVVSVAGYNVGKVDEMMLAGSSIAVKVSLEDKVRLPVDSRALIKSASIMGGKYIAITPGVDPNALADGDTLRGSYEADITELTSTLSPISSNVLGILQNVNATFDERTRKGLQDIVRDVNSSTQAINNVIQSHRGKIERVIDNFNLFSQNLTRFSMGLDTMAKAQGRTLDSTLVTVKSLAANLDRAGQQLLATTESIDAIIGRVQSGNGTIGKLVREERLYDNLDSLTVSLNSLIRDLQENPSRYVKLSLF